MRFTTLRPAFPALQHAFILPHLRPNQRAIICIIAALTMFATMAPQAFAQLDGLSSPRNFHTNPLPSKQIKLCDRGLAAATDLMRTFSWADAEQSLLKLTVSKPQCSSHLGFAVSLRLLALALDWGRGSLVRIAALDRRLAPNAGQWVQSVVHKPTVDSSAFVYSCDSGCGGFADRMKGIQSVFLLAFLNDGMASFLHARPFDINDIFQLATPAMPPPEWRWDEQKWVRIALQDFSLSLNRRALEGIVPGVNPQVVEGHAAFARDVLLAPMSVWLPPKHSFDLSAFNVDIYPLLRMSPLHAARVASVYDRNIASSASFMRSFLSQETTFSHRYLDRMFSLKRHLCNGNVGVHVRTGKGGWTDRDFLANVSYFVEVGRLRSCAMRVV